MIYDAVKAVLAALDTQGNTDHDDWSERVATNLATLEGSYRELRDASRDLIDYSDLAIQAAYVFRYVLSHADFVYDFLSYARETTDEALFEAEEIWVTSVGGGPGSELLGLLKYLSEDNGEPKVARIVYTVVDKERNWQHVVESFVDRVDTEIEIELRFQTCDVSAAQLPASVTLKDEELVFMSFFISEVCELPEKNHVINNLNTLLKTMKPDAFLVYNDSDAYSFYTFLNNRVNNATRFEQLIDLDTEYKIKAPDYDGIMGNYVEQFDYRPKLSSKAVTKLLRRTE